MDIQRVRHQKKTKKDMNITLLDIKGFYKATRIKTMWCSHRNTKVGNGTEKKTHKQAMDIYTWFIIKVALQRNVRKQTF